MNRSLLLSLVICTQIPVVMWAQEGSPLLKPLNELPTLGEHSTSGEPNVRKKEAVKAAKPGQTKGPTEINSTKGVTFDEKSRVGVFTGDVRVKDPQFNLSADKLTVLLKKDEAGADKPKASPAQSGTSSANGSKGPDSSLGGGLEKAIAEGHVIVIQDKPAEDGGEPKHYVGKANKLEYDSKTGDVTLTGWPQIQQGINTQAATEEGTIMVLNRDGHMRTTGGCHTIIQDSSEAKAK